MAMEEEAEAVANERDWLVCGADGWRVGAAAAAVVVTAGKGRVRVDVKATWSVGAHGTPPPCPALPRLTPPHPPPLPSRLLSIPSPFFSSFHRRPMCAIATSLLFSPIEGEFEEKKIEKIGKILKMR